MKNEISFIVLSKQGWEDLCCREEITIEHCNLFHFFMEFLHFIYGVRTRYLKWYLLVCKDGAWGMPDLGL